MKQQLQEWAMTHCSYSGELSKLCVEEKSWDTKEHRLPELAFVRLHSELPWVESKRYLSAHRLQECRDCGGSAYWPSLCWLGHTIIKAQQSLYPRSGFSLDFFFQFLKSWILWDSQNKTIASILIVICQLNEAKEVKSLKCFHPILHVFMRIPTSLKN